MQTPLSCDLYDTAEWMKHDSVLPDEDWEPSLQGWTCTVPIKCSQSTQPTSTCWEAYVGRTMYTVMKSSHLASGLPQNCSQQWQTD